MLPQPDHGFAWVHAPGGDALVCLELEPFASHLFTTRAWRLGSATAEQREDAWADVAEAAGVEPDRLVRLHQIHGAAVVVVRGPRPSVELPAADVVVTDDAQSALAIQTADCVPLLIADRRTGAVAAAHAGWRGIAARVPHAATAALRREFGSQPDDLIAAIGPSIGTCCYEVGGDVRDAFVDASFDADQISRWFTDAPRPTARNPSMPGLSPTRRPEHWFFDGPGAVRDQLRACGVPQDRVYAADLCTASHPELCSYRRDGLEAGRIAAMIRPRGARR
jgi:YfiH family protein